MHVSKEFWSVREKISYSMDQINLRLCLVLEKFEEKCKGKIIKRKSRRKEKIKKNKKQI